MQVHSLFGSPPLRYAMASFEIFVKVVERCRSRLGLFLATFLHSLLTFAIAGQRGNQIFVPELTVLTDIGLVLASFGCLIVYNNRVAQAIQTNNVIPKIVENLYAAISELADSQAIVTPEVAPVPAGETVRALRVQHQAILDQLEMKLDDSGHARHPPGRDRAAA